jgi:prevent-host-death family protein
MTKSVSVAEAKGRFSELVNRAAYGKERFLIERRGKLVGAIVSAEDLARLEEKESGPAPRGLLALAGLMDGIDDFEEIMEEVVRERATRSLAFRVSRSRTGSCKHS